MSRISLSASILIVIVCWQACATPTRGHPVAGREQISARRRDDLLVGSDFLNMFIGSPASSSAVRSRRYPPINEHRNRLAQDRTGGGDTHSRDIDLRENFTENLESNERLSGLIRARDRTPNYQYQQHQTDKDSQRGVRKFTKSPVERNIEVVDDEAAGADKMIHEAMASDQSFGARTAPRVGATSVTTEHSSYSVDETSPELDNVSVSSSDNDDIPINSRVPVKDFNVSVLPKFSVSSSVHKITSRSRQNIRNSVYQSTQIPVTYSDVNPLTSQDAITEDITTDKTSSSLDVQFTASDIAQQTTDSQSTIYEAATVTSIPDVDSTEAMEDWSTKSDTATTEISDESHMFTQTQTPGLLYSQTPIQVVSVRVSSSVAQTPVPSRSKSYDIRTMKSASDFMSKESPVDNKDYLSETAGSLEIAEQPPATSIQRSDFSVEESAPSEVTSDPQRTYASFHSYDRSPISYPSSVTSATSGSRLQFFNKPPNYRRGLSYLRRTSTDSSGHTTTASTFNPRRHISLHSLPRSYVPRSSTSLPQTSRREPVLLAESIQRSVIANQDEDDAQLKDRFDGIRGSKSFQPRESIRKGYRPQERVFELPEKVYEEPEKVYEEPEKVYEEPEKLYGEPAKVYGEPAKVYGVPSKIYGVPAKVYGEPAKIYGEPAKIYGEPAKVYGEPAKVYGVPAKIYGQPAQIYGEPAKVYGEPSKVYGEPAKVYGEPAKVYGEPAKSYADPERNYEVDESVSVGSNGRSHGVQPVLTTPQDATTPADTDMKVFDTKQQDPNHKFGYVVEGRDYRKYRVEERTSDGFIVGEYGVVSHDGDNLRGVRYTADSTINPRLIYDTLLKFLSL